MSPKSWFISLNIDEKVCGSRDKTAVPLRAAEMKTFYPDNNAAHHCLQLSKHFPVSAVRAEHVVIALGKHSLVSEHICLQFT